MQNQIFIEKHTNCLYSSQSFPLFFSFCIIFLLKNPFFPPHLRLDPALQLQTHTPLSFACSLQIGRRTPSWNVSRHAAICVCERKKKSSSAVSLSALLSHSHTHTCCCFFKWSQTQPNRCSHTSPHQAKYSRERCHFLICGSQEQSVMTPCLKSRTIVVSVNRTLQNLHHSTSQELFYGLLMSYLEQERSYHCCVTDMS